MKEWLGLSLEVVGLVFKISAVTIVALAALKYLAS